MPQNLLSILRCILKCFFSKYLKNRCTLILRHVGPRLFLQPVTNEQQFPFLHFVAYSKMFKARV